MGDWKVLQYFSNMRQNSAALNASDDILSVTKYSMAWGTALSTAYLKLPDCQGLATRAKFNEIRRTMVDCEMVSSPECYSLDVPQWVRIQSWNPRLPFFTWSLTFPQPERNFLNYLVIDLSHNEYLLSFP